MCIGGLPFGKVGMGFLVIIQRQSPLLKLNSIQILRRYTVYFHGNTILNRAKELAEIAANTFCLAPISFSFPKGKTAVLQYKSKHLVLPPQHNYKSKQLRRRGSSS